MFQIITKEGVYLGDFDSRKEARKNVRIHKSIDRVYDKTGLCKYEYFHYRIVKAVGIETLDFSVRLYYALKRNHIDTVNQLHNINLLNLSDSKYMSSRALYELCYYFADNEIDIVS